MKRRSRRRVTGKGREKPSGGLQSGISGGLDGWRVRFHLELILFTVLMQMRLEGEAQQLIVCFYFPLGLHLSGRGRAAYRRVVGVVVVYARFQIDSVGCASIVRRPSCCSLSFNQK